MRKNLPIGMPKRPFSLLPIFWGGLLPIFLLPWLQMEGAYYSGLALLFTAPDLLPVWPTAAAALLCVLAGVWLVLRPNRRVVQALCVCLSAAIILGAYMLFSAKRTADASGLLPRAFLVRDLGIGFWIYLALLVCGLVCAMQSVKITPSYILLTVLSVIWLFPIFWLVMTSFRAESGRYSAYFIPKALTLNNYSGLITDTALFQYARWYGNTVVVALLSCLLSTLIVLSTAYALSRVRFAMRRKLMNFLLILGMFPGFMSMIAVYYIIKGLGLSQSLAALVIVYGGGSAMGYYVVKGFFDTIPRSIDEAALIDGATRWQLFTRITIPLSKPIIIYTILTSFMAPWADYIFSSVILGDNSSNYTVAIGLYKMLQREQIDQWYVRFAAGAVLVAVPIAILFISLQKYYVEGLVGSVKG